MLDVFGDGSIDIPAGRLVVAEGSILSIQIFIVEINLPGTQRSAVLCQKEQKDYNFSCYNETCKKMR